MYLVAGIVALVMLVTGVVTAANADDAKNGAPPGPGFGAPANDTMLEKVAQILGIDKQKVSDAFKQAGAAMEQQRINDMFAKWVTDGKLTQAQADQYKAWLATKPDGVPGFFGCSDNATRENDMLSRLLKDGKITQTQSDAITAWLAKKPNIELPKPEKPTGVSHGAPGLSVDMLDKLLKDGKITQATYDAYKTWLSQKPSIELPAPDGPPGNPPGGSK